MKLDNSFSPNLIASQDSQEVDDILFNCMYFLNAFISRYTSLNVIYVKIFNEENYLFYLFLKDLTKFWDGDICRDLLCKNIA